MVHRDSCDSLQLIMPTSPSCHVLLMSCIAALQICVLSMSVLYMPKSKSGKAHLPSGMGSGPHALSTGTVRTGC